MADKNRTMCKAIIGMHSFTGCDSVSAFMGRGKAEPLKLLIKNERYIKLFATLGETWSVSSDLFSNVQEFVCRIYGTNNLADVNIHAEKGPAGFLLSPCLLRHAA